MVENTPVVKEEVTTPQAPEAKPAVEPEKEEPAKTVPGTKTEPELLLKSLQEEREKRRLLEEELNNLKSSVPSETEAFSDEGKALEAKIKQLEQKFVSIEEEKNMAVLYSKYPVLKENSDKFLQYKNTEHPRAKLESVAKLFLAENDLLEPPRKGLEKTTGGKRIQLSSGITAQDAENLMKTNYKKYREMIKSGQLKIE